MNKSVKIFLATIAFAAIAVTGVEAAGSSQCQAVYGGGEVCPPSIKFTLDKKVQNPSNGQFVDNLSVNDPKFGATQTITFQITVTNTGSDEMKDVTVTDTLPQHVSFVSGPGSYDQGKNTLTIKINSLAAGKSQTFDIVTKAAEVKNLPNQDVVCVTNMARVTESRGSEATDNAQLCIEKKVTTTTGKGGPVVQPPVKVTQTPETGPEMFSLFALIPAGATGLYLRRKSNFK